MFKLYFSSNKVVHVHVLIKLNKVFHSLNLVSQFHAHKILDAFCNKHENCLCTALLIIIRVLIENLQNLQIIFQLDDFAPF